MNCFFYIYLNPTCKASQNEANHTIESVMQPSRRVGPKYADEINLC